MSDYVHSIPGRLRVKSAIIKKNPAAAGKIRVSLSPTPGVRQVDVNLLTGSVLIHYDFQGVSADELLRKLNQAGYFKPSEAVTHDDLLHAMLTRTGKAIGSLALGALEIDSPALAILAAVI
jgi:hypothetical protein